MLDVRKKCPGLRGSEVKSKKVKTRTTVTRYLFFEQRKVFGSTGEFTLLFECIQEILKSIAAAVSNYGLYKGMQIDRIPLGDYKGKNLVEHAELIFFSSLTTCASVSLLSSSLFPEIINVDSKKRGKYVVTFSPLEGFADDDSYSALGSTFSVYKRVNVGKALTKEDILQEGSLLIGAGYAVYGSSSCLVLSLGSGMGALEFTLDPSTSEWILTEPKLEIPHSGSTYVLNEGKSRDMPPNVVDYIAKRKDPKLGQKMVNTCYTGCIVADFHKVLKTGGIIISPGLVDFPEGTLKLQYVCNPLAFILKEAGGYALNGSMSILDVPVLRLQQNTPLIAGSEEEVREVTRYLSMWSGSDSNTRPWSQPTLVSVE